jgi:hypothetical protein
MFRAFANAKHAAHLICVNPFGCLPVPYLLLLTFKKSLQPFHALRPFDESALVDDYYSFHIGSLFRLMDAKELRFCQTAKIST